ncbi:MAG: membrane protein insertion efficiency factor YidD [Rhodospirillaceae bacterium]|nr:membrane protein insertion efficiency factor YidD [Rhodospirillaceae bacterium]
MARIIRFAIQVYQVCISPFFPAHCRYWPTCSVYAAKAVRDHGAVSGGMLAARRIVRCHPWGGWGYDPVPEPKFSEPNNSGSCCIDITPGGHSPDGATRLEQGT